MSRIPIEGPGSIGADLILVPPWLVLTLLISWFHGSLFFLLGGTRGRQLLFYLLFAGLMGTAGQLLATHSGFVTKLDVGDCNILAVTSACWLGYALTRLGRIIQSSVEARS